MDHNIERNFEKGLKKGLALTAKVARKAGAFLLKKIAAALGIPAGIVFVVFVVAVIIFFSIYGELPAQVKESGMRREYEEVIAKYAPEIISEDRAEEQYMLTWGMLAAIDLKKHMLQSESPEDRYPFTAEDTAQKLMPIFSYIDSVIIIIERETDEEGNTTTTRTEIPVKLVSEVDTFRGIFKLHYERKTFERGDTTIIKDVLSYTEYFADWTRLKQVMEEQGIPADDDAAYLMYKTAEAFESGAPHFAWLTESEEEIWISGSVGWDWTSSEYYVPEELVAYFEEAASETGLDIELLKAVAAIESCFNPEAVSKAGAKGIMQLMPNTAKQLGVTNIFDPRENILAGARYLKQMLDRFKEPELALAAYNAGPGNVEKYGGLPPFKETQDYVSKVMNLWKEGIPVSDSKFIVPVHGPITSPFGQRIHPIRQAESFHSGIDIGAPLGTPIRASKEGRVKFTGSAGGYGLTVIIDHGNGYTTTYAHCLSINVYEGQRVSKGQIIAQVGSTGVSTGPHLHFEIRVNGKAVNPINYLQ